MRLIIGLIVVLFIAGCGSIPFKETGYVSIDHEDPAAVAERYKNNIPEYIRIINTMVVEYNRKKFSCLGFIDINTTAGTYAAACLNPAGMKLFELSGSREGMDGYSVTGEFSHKEAFAGIIGQDIQRIYFDLAPPPSATAKRKKYEIIFRLESGPGATEYVFAGADAYLVKKNYYENNHLKWRVSYYEYKEKAGGIYPGGIIFNDFLYGYTVTLRLKEILN